MQVPAGLWSPGIAQYLFALSPRHNQGIRIRGFKFLILYRSEYLHIFHSLFEQKHSSYLIVGVAFSDLYMSGTIIVKPKMVASKASEEVYSRQCRGRSECGSMYRGRSPCLSLGTKDVISTNSLLFFVTKIFEYIGVFKYFPVISN